MPAPGTVPGITVEYVRGLVSFAHSLGALTITYEGLLGDANSDGVVDYVDAIYVLEYDAKLRTADELAYGLCDVNGDGAVDYVDAIFILEYDAKLITKFPAAV